MRTHVVFLSCLLTLATVSAGTRVHGPLPTKTPMPLAPAALTTADLTQGQTPQSLVSALLGPGITASNVVYNGAPVAAGTFQGGTGILGFESGIILSSGCISNIPGPNVSDWISCDNLLPGDLDLDLLSGYPTQDATLLEFDFVPSDPTGTTLLFSYVFSSDEYNEYVYTPFNDVFAFYVNGQNCALVPGIGAGPDPVTINTVNGGNPFASGNEQNPVLYRNNDLDDGGGTIDTEMDGLTVILSCQAAITPNATNHIKLAIADASDGIFDSNVMIRVGSLTPTDLVITLVPPSAVNPVGTSHTVTATVRDNLGVPQPGREIGFEVLSGPNAGALGTCSASAECLTDVNGNVSFTYTGSLVEGTDVIRACFDDVGGNDNCSPGVTKHWTLPCGADGTPCGGTPAACEYQSTCLNDVCQTNGFKPATTECRAAATACDLTEFCTGSDPDCPLDQHLPDGSLCTDGSVCTTEDSCLAGSCVGIPQPTPAEVGQDVWVAMDHGMATVGWSPAVGATSYELVRGLASGLPVGPGGQDEVCLGSVPTPPWTFRDGSTPAAGAAFWYLVRGVNDCDEGPWGYQAAYGVPTVPRTTATCQ